MHGESGEMLDRMLIARIVASSGDRVALATALDDIPRNDASSRDLGVIELLRCVVEDSPVEVWNRALEAVDSMLDDDLRVELGFLAARRGVLDAPARAQVRALATKHPIWSRRVDEL